MPERAAKYGLVDRMNMIDGYEPSSEVSTADVREAKERLQYAETNYVIPPHSEVMESLKGLGNDPRDEVAESMIKRAFRESENDPHSNFSLLNATELPDLDFSVGGGYERGVLDRLDRIEAGDKPQVFYKEVRDEKGKLTGQVLVLAVMNNGTDDASTTCSWGVFEKDADTPALNFDYERRAFTTDLAQMKTTFRQYYRDYVRQGIGDLDIGEHTNFLEKSKDTISSLFGGQGREVSDYGREKAEEIRQKGAVPGVPSMLEIALLGGRMTTSQYDKRFRQIRGYSIDEYWENVAALNMDSSIDKSRAIAEREVSKEKTAELIDIIENGYSLKVENLRKEWLAKKDARREQLADKREELTGGLIEDLNESKFLERILTLPDTLHESELQGIIGFYARAFKSRGLTKAQVERSVKERFNQLKDAGKVELTEEESLERGKAALEIGLKIAASGWESKTFKQQNPKIWGNLREIFDAFSEPLVPEESSLMADIKSKYEAKFSDELEEFTNRYEVLIANVDKDPSLLHDRISEIDKELKAIDKEGPLSFDPRTKMLRERRAELAKTYQSLVKL